MRGAWLTKNASTPTTKSSAAATLVLLNGIVPVRGLGSLRFKSHTWKKAPGESIEIWLQGLLDLRRVQLYEKS
jgi:hypothetical protein